MKKGFTVVELMTVVAIIAIILTSIFQPLFEMRSFNKFSDTGVKATYWDAMFSQLRIEANRVSR